jgi:phage gp36-like protein
MYCTIDDLKKTLPEQEIIELTDDENLKPTVIDAADADCDDIIERIYEAIEAADAEIDGYCTVRYGTPLSPVPVLINKLSIEIAVYHLIARRPPVAESAEKRYERALARLKDISKGILSLGIDPPPEASTMADSPATNTALSDRVCTKTNMEGF